jgi:hypothetical protein
MSTVAKFATVTKVEQTNGTVTLTLDTTLPSDASITYMEIKKGAKSFDPPKVFKFTTKKSAVVGTKNVTTATFLCSNFNHKVTDKLTLHATKSEVETLCTKSFWSTKNIIMVVSVVLLAVAAVAAAVYFLVYKKESSEGDSEGDSETNPRDSNKLDSYNSGSFFF